MLFITLKIFWLTHKRLCLVANGYQYDMGLFWACKIPTRVIGTEYVRTKIVALFSQLVEAQISMVALVTIE